MPVIRQFISPLLVSYKTIAESLEPVNTRRDPIGS